MARLPKKIAPALKNITKAAFTHRGFSESRLIADWPRIVGKELATHSLPQKLSFSAGKTTGGVLTIQVESGFALELQHMEPAILDKVATYFGYRAVGRCAFVQAPLPRQKEPVRTPPSPLSEKEKQALAELTATTTDEELKAALQALGEAVIRKNHN